MPELKHPVTVAAPVIHGRGLGHKLGTPTVNQQLQDTAKQLEYGVYFSRCTVGGVTYNSITNIGVKPTVSEDGIAVAETHILDCDVELYGSDVLTELVFFRRPEIKFSSEEELSRKIREDVLAARNYFKNETV